MQPETRKNSLEIGTEVTRYEIREILGMGGFGITYKAWDPKFKRMVAIKEYLPVETAGRAHDSIQVHAIESQQEEYQYGLKQFIKEAQTLALFRHQNIVIAYDYIEVNNTAYLVMEYVQGQTLGQRLKQQGGKLEEAELKALLMPLLQGLDYIHQQDYYHRDIKPANIYLRNQNEPVLIDFGAARQAVGTRSRSLTSIVSAGYAPPEQYGSNQKKLGPWSDLYSIGATFYCCVSGKPPTDAPTRRNELADGDPDPLIAASIIAKPHYSAPFLKLIDWMLEPVIRERPQNVQELIQQLEHKQQPIEARSTAVTVQIEEAQTTAPTRINKEKKPQQPIVDPEISIPLALKQTDGSKKPDESIESPDRSTPTEEANPKSKSKVIPIGLSIAILAIIGISQKQAIEKWVTAKNDPAELIHAQSRPLKVQQTQQAVPKVEALKKEEGGNKQTKKQEQLRQEEIKYQQQRQAKIQATLTKAATDIKQLRLSSPKGNNAVEKYIKVLQWEPDNPQAQQGLTNITDKYLQLADKSLKKQQHEKVRQYLAKAKIIQADNPEIKTAEENLQVAEEAYQTYQQEQAEENSFNIAMIKVNPGCFQMGSNEGESDETQHRVCLTQAYDLGKYEVTQAQWQKVMGNNPSSFKGSNKPVEKVSWNDVQSFIRKLNEQTGQGYRLPTEAEWEYACRSGGKDQKYCGGNNVNSVGWYGSNSGSTTHNVGQKQANGLGFYDMSGNVYEWVQDWYDSGYYNNSPTNNPTGASGGSLRVSRGGSWDFIASYLRSAYRFYISPGNSVYDLGFRLARTR